MEESSKDALNPALSPQPSSESESTSSQPAPPVETVPTALLADASSAAPQKSSKLGLAWKALTLQADAYQPVVASPKPGRMGLSILLVVLLIAGLGTMLGLVFDWLTEPNYSQLESQIVQTVRGTQFYQTFAADKPTLAAVFQITYQILSFFARMNGAYPNGLAIAASFFNVLLTGLFDWLTYAFIIGLLARWFGGKAERNTLWGTMALAFSPNLVQVLNVIPGLVIPYLLLRPWTMATSYQALRASYQISRTRAIIIVLIAPLVNALFIFLALVGGVLLGVLVYQLIS